MRPAVTFRKVCLAADLPGWLGKVPSQPGGAAGLRRVVHDAVVAAAGSCAAGAGPVAAQHLRGTPAVELHEVALGAAPVQPGVAEVMPEPVREHLDTALASATDYDLVD